MEFLDNAYQIQGIRMSDLVDEFHAPLYVYDGAAIVSQYKRLVSSFSVKQLKINYACKALSNISVLRLFKSLGAGIDTVSPGEIQLALAAGFDPQDIVFTPNSVSIKEYEYGIEMGVRLNIDNIETLEYFGHHLNNTPICIRINPHVMAGGNTKISVGHIDSKFGISIHQMPLVKRIVETLGIEVEGIHMHTGSDILDVDVFLRATEILFQTAKEFPQLSYIDFGSGFKVAYKEGDYETDIELFGERVSQRFNAFCKEYGRQLTLMFEPGKLLVSAAGYFLAKTNVVKQTTSTIFACLDTGFNHLIRPMFYDSYHEILNISNPSGNPKIYTVVGYICETDTFGWNRKISEIRVGDILAFKNAGAYAFSMASNYNTRLLPAEVLLYNGKAHLIRRRQTFDDILATTVVPEIEFAPNLVVSE